MFAKGKQIRLGDRVLVANHVIGIVVFSIDTGEYSPEFPKADWEYLSRGIMVQTEGAGLIYIAELSDPEEDIKIIG
jgi:hypothetical protein